MAGKNDTYNTQKQSNFSFIFTSIGPNGSFKKIIVFDLIEPKSLLYNLAFGDLQDGQLNDRSVSNNEDTWKILATVANEVERLLNDHPGAIVYAEGSTPSRTRLYRMGLTKYYDVIIEKYTVLGYENVSWLVFKKGIEYKAFLIFKTR